MTLIYIAERWQNFNQIHSSITVAQQKDNAFILYINSNSNKTPNIQTSHDKNTQKIPITTIHIKEYQKRKQK